MILGTRWNSAMMMSLATDKILSGYDRGSDTLSAPSKIGPDLLME